MKLFQHLLVLTALASNISLSTSHKMMDASYTQLSSKRLRTSGNDSVTESIFPLVFPKQMAKRSAIIPLKVTKPGEGNGFTIHFFIDLAAEKSIISSQCLKEIGMEVNKEHLSPAMSYYNALEFSFIGQQYTENLKINDQFSFQEPVIVENIGPQIPQNDLQICGIISLKDFVPFQEHSSFSIHLNKTNASKRRIVASEANQMIHSYKKIAEFPAKHPFSFEIDQLNLIDNQTHSLHKQWNNKVEKYNVKLDLFSNVNRFPKVIYNDILSELERKYDLKCKFVEAYNGSICDIGAMQIDELPYFMLKNTENERYIIISPMEYISDQQGTTNKYKLLIEENSDNSSEIVLGNGAFEKYEVIYESGQDSSVSFYDPSTKVRGSGEKSVVGRVQQLLNKFRMKNNNYELEMIIVAAILIYFLVVVLCTNKQLKANSNKIGYQLVTDENLTVDRDLFD